MKKLGYIFFTITSINCFSQQEPKIIKHYWSINLGELLLTTPKLSYEFRTSQTKSWNLEASYKFQIISYSPNPSFSPFDGTYDFDQMNPYCYQNFSISVGRNYFLRSKKEMEQPFLSVRFMFKHNFCKNTILVDGTDGFYYYSIISGFENFHEMKLLFGQKTLHPWRKPGLFSFMEFYIGIGASVKNGKHSYYYEIEGRDPTPNIDNLDFGGAKYRDERNLKIGPRLYVGLTWGQGTQE